MREIELSNGEKVTMREPKVRDVRLLKSYKDAEEKELKLCANLTGLSDAELDEMSLKDYGLLQKAMQDFLS